MIVVVTGDRHWKGEKRHESVCKALSTLDRATDHVVMGDCRGVDTMARKACEELQLRHSVNYADWRIGPGAGPERNSRMLEEGVYRAERSATQVEVWYFHDDIDNSKGTADCVRQAKRRGITVKSYASVVG